MKLTICAQGIVELSMRPLPRHPDNRSGCGVEVPIPHRSQHFLIIENRCVRTIALLIIQYLLSSSVSPSMNLVLFSSLTLKPSSH